MNILNGSLGRCIRFLVIGWVCAGLFCRSVLMSSAENLSDSALQQISALRAFKESLPPLARKIDSQLTLALKESRNEPIAGVPQLRANVKFEANGQVMVDIDGNITGALLNLINANGGKVISSTPNFHTLRAVISLDQVEVIAESGDVKFIRPAVQAITNTGSVTSQGDATHSADTARTNFVVDGSGVNVGVLSDSVDFLANSQSLGDLPSDLVILPGQSGVPASGEGTAMLEIVHDLAPGSKLYFATAFSGAGGFAQNILNLRAAGCDVIIDDVFYFNESPFQDGIIAQAVTSVAADGALYFSAAGNEGNKKDNTAGTWEGDFADGGAAGAPVNGKGGVLHSFGTQAYNVCNRPGSATVLFWSDPLGASTNDYDLYVLDSTGANIRRSSINIQDGTQDPFEIVSSPATGERLVIVKASGDARYLHMDTIGGRLSISTAGNIKGHCAAVDAFAVGAVNAATSFPNPFIGGAQNPVETFSSDGPRRFFYNADGSAVTPGNFLSTGGAVRLKPDIAAADGVVTTLPSNSGLNPFFGTSAAAPHAGAVAALLKSYDPSLSAAQIRNAFTNTSLDIEGAGRDDNSGIGIVMALPALQFLPIPIPRPNLFLLTNTLAGGNGNGLIDFNECNTLTVTLTNSGRATATGVEGILTSTNLGVIIAQSVSTFPDIPVGGTGVNFIPYRISTSPEFICGTTVDLTLVIKSDVDSRTNLIHLPSGVIGAPIRLDNNTVFQIPDANPIGISSPIVVSNFSGSVGKVTVGLYLTHTYDSDLLIQLIAPDGTTVNLSQNNGLSGDNFGSSCNPDTSRTTFDDSASLAISAGNPPFIGAFAPDQPLSTFNLKTGLNANGTWKLRVIDEVPIDIGALHCWSLFLSPITCTDGGGECPGSDMGVSMVDFPDPVVVGSNLTYFITVTNGGPSTAKSVVLSQSLPPGVVFVTATNSQGNVSQSGGVVTANYGRISARGTATTAVTVRPTATGSISSTATVSSEQTDADPSNNSVTVFTQVVQPSADLGVTIVDSPDPVGVGSTLTYTIAVTNRGPVAATGIKLTNTLPASATFVSASSTQGTFVSTGGTIIYSLGAITNGGGALVTIVVRPGSIGTITATSRVVANEADLIPANNVATATTTVAPSADLGVTIIDTPHPVVVGSNVTFVITVTNRGPNVANAVTVNGSLPANATFVTNSLSQGSFSRSGNSYSASLGTLLGGSGATITIVVTAPPQTPQDIILTANVSAAEGDPDSGNNSASRTAVSAAPFVFITPAGSRLTAESQSPANGTIDLGETVSVELSLRNAGNVNTTNLIATLLAGSGVTSPSGAQSYGSVAAGGTSVARTFSFTASGSYGQTITATLRLQDGSGPVTNVNFNFVLPTLNTFTNTNAIVIPTIGNASPYPSQITVSGVTGLVSKVTVSLNRINHTYPDDIDVLLVDPTGRKVLLMSDAGGGNGLTDVTLTLDPDASSPLADADQIVSGTFRPADYSPSDTFPSAPVGPYDALLHGLDGTSPNGVWSLYVVDDTSGDLGNIAGGWSVAITTVSPVNKVADLAVTAVNPPNSVVVNQDASFTFSAVNNGPDIANSVILSNDLPSGATFVSASQPVVVNGSTIIGNLGNLASGSNASVTIVIRPTVAGTLTNTAVVSANETDVNAINNSVTVLASVVLPVADLGLTLSATPNPVVGRNLTYTLVVANNGPETASGIVVTNRLPSSTTFVSANSSQGTCSNSAGVVTCSIGSIPPGSLASVSITVTPVTTGAITNTANVVSAANDSNSANNSASVISLVANPSPNIVASGSTLISESSPPNGTVDPGETVTIAFALANIGTANTTNLVATLLATGGVAAPSTSQTYGVLISDGPAVSRNFTFTASSASSGTITATLQLQDGAVNRGNVAYTFALPQHTNFTNGASISIANSGPATPYPSTITISGASGLVSKVAVTLNGLSHSFPDDLDIMLVSPSGGKVMLMSDAGGAHALSAVNLTFDDSGAALPDATQISSGTFRPTDFESGDSLPSPAPAAPYAGTLSAMNGGNPNGVWSLYVNDDAVGDAGSISGGWRLALITVNTVNPAANLSVTMTDAPDPVVVQGHLVYTIVVSNQGPGTATSVVVTDTLPAGVSPFSTSSSQGDSGIVGQTATFALGALNVGSSATAVFTVTPTIAGTVSNLASIAANEVDLYLGNNSAQTSTLVQSAPAARLGSAAVLSNGSFQLVLSGQAGATYRIDASTNLTTWVAVSTNTAGGNGMFIFTDTAAASYQSRFYRAVRLP